MRTLSVSILTIVIISSKANAGNGEPVEVVCDKNTKSQRIEVGIKSGQELLVLMPGNPTAGYRWANDNDDLTGEVTEFKFYYGRPKQINSECTVSVTAE